jgi:hypothetical protein
LQSASLEYFFTIYIYLRGKIGANYRQRGKQGPWWYQISQWSLQRFSNLLMVLSIVISRIRQVFAKTPFGHNISSFEIEHVTFSTPESTFLRASILDLSRIHAAFYAHQVEVLNFYRPANIRHFRNSSASLSSLSLHSPACLHIYLQPKNVSFPLQKYT